MFSCVKHTTNNKLCLLFKQQLNHDGNQLKGNELHKMDQHTFNLNVKDAIQAPTTTKSKRNYKYSRTNWNENNQKIRYKTINIKISINICHYGDNK